jgi:hypothetical protein
MASFLSTPVAIEAERSAGVEDWLPGFARHFEDREKFDTG